MVKNFNIKEENLEIINKVRQDNNLTTATAAVNFIIADYDRLLQKKKEEQNQTDALIDAIMNHKLMTRIRWASETAEKNSIYMLDAMNTILQKNGIYDAVPVDTIPSPVITTSKELYQKKLDHFKQQAENRKHKK